MKKVIKNLLLWLFSVMLLGFTFSQNVKNLNSNLNIATISSTQANNYRQTCLTESNSDDNLRWAYYVWNSVSPKYGYSYSASNANRARSVLDTTSMLIYNPGTFSTNWVFKLLSNITLNGGNTKITRPDNNIPIINNTVWRNNLAGMFVLKWDYRTVLLWTNNNSNLLWYRIDYFQNTPLYVQRNYSFVNSTVVRYSCVWYYVAKCWDGIVDNVNKTWNSNVDGKYGILIGWNIVQWSVSSPNEVCDDGINNGQTGYCNASCDGYVTQMSWILSINKSLLSTWNLYLGDFVDYKIELRNIGSWIVHSVFMKDVLPQSLTLISHNVIWLNTYTSNQWQDALGNWFVEYSGFDLAPWQTIYFNVRGQIRTGASLNKTTNCAFTIWDYDCVFYNLSAKPYLLKSQKVVNPSINMPFTTGVVNVTPGDYIVYMLEFKNIGWWNTTWWVRIVDHMPLCVNYISASINGVTNANFTQWQDINWRWILEYNWFNLLAWQSAYVIITGQIMNTQNCLNQNQYLNNSYLYFNNPFSVIESNVNALKTNKSIVNLSKNSNIHSHFPWENKLFEIKVTNYWPNAISNIVLQDIWPSFNNCITYVDWTWSLGMTKNPNSLIWNFPWLGVWDSINLYISWSILNSSSCVKPDYENIINLTYTELWIQHQDQAKYYFEVKPMPLANVSLIKTVDKSIVKSWDNVTYTVIYQNMWNTPLLSYNIVDYWPAMVNFISATPFPSNILNFNTWSVLTWLFNSQLLPGQTWQIILHWIVK